MSYLNTQYTKNNVIGKTISDITEDNGYTYIHFTDGTSLRLQPDFVVEKPIVKHVGIVANVFTAQGGVVPARDGE